MQIVYNMNRGKQAQKTGKDFMPTFEESEDSKQDKPEINKEELYKEIKQKYGG